TGYDLAAPSPRASDPAAPVPSVRVQVAGQPVDRGLGAAATVLPYAERASDAAPLSQDPTVVPGRVSFASPEPASPPSVGSPVSYGVPASSVGSPVPYVDPASPPSVGSPMTAGSP